MSPRALIVSTLLLAFVPACQTDEVTPFLEGLQPLEAVTVPPPAATATDRYPEVFVTRRGTIPAWGWAQGTGYLHAPIARVYEAFRDPAVTADRREITSFTVTHNVAPIYPYSFLIHNVINDIVTVEFDEEFRIGPLAGTATAPTTVIARYQKVRGTSFISLMEGDFVANVVDANTTMIQMVRHVQSIGNGEVEEEIYLHDVFNSLRASVRGQPLPTY